MTGQVAICRISEIPEGRGRVVRLGDRAIALFKDQGQIHAILDRCPHAGASLGRGWTEDGAVVCPLHFWRFRLADGHCLAGSEESHVPRFPVDIRDGWVWITDPASNANANSNDSPE